MHWVTVQRGRGPGLTPRTGLRCPAMECSGPSEQLSGRRLEAAAGDEAVIKAATFQVSGEKRYGCFGAARVTGWCACRRFDSRPAPDELRRRRGGAVPSKHGRGRDHATTMSVDTYRASVAGVQPSPTDSALRVNAPPEAVSSVHCRTSAAIVYPRDGDGDSARQSCF